MFVDKATITIKAGKGGNGAVSFRREPFVPKGGPDGGDGGKGGDIVIKADANLRTLMDQKYKTKYKAENGQDGMRKKCFGKDGEDLVIKVPVGTLIIDKESGKIMNDLVEDGASFVAAKGGKGGRGNTHYKSSVRQAPDFAEAGERPDEREIVLELKMIADVGLVGFPNVGKSSLLSVSTNARPKIDNYHFTTLEPNLGVAYISDSEFVMADIAGIIEGAHEGAGLGFEFLKHIERTRVLIHVIDVSGSEGRDPKEDFDSIMNELSSYSPKLAKKPMLVAGNKTDIADSESIEDLRSYIEGEKGLPFFSISAATGRGVDDLLKKALETLSVTPQEEPETDLWMTAEDYEDEDRDKVNIEFDGDAYVLTGKKLRKIFDSTNMNDTSSLRYLYKYLDKSGAIAQMKEMGLDEGDTISIYGMEFDYVEEYPE